MRLRCSRELGDCDWFWTARLLTALGSLQFTLLCGCSMMPSDKPDGIEGTLYCDSNVLICMPKYQRGVQCLMQTSVHCWFKSHVRLSHQRFSELA
jgi:hypothetical protein